LASPQDSVSGKSRLSLRSRSWIAAGIVFAIFIVSVVLLIRLLRNRGWVLLPEIALFYLVLTLLLSALGTALYSAAVYVLVRASGHRTTFIQAYLVLTASLSANYVTPVKFGIPLRIYLYKQVMQIPFAVGTALVALETWLGMLIPAVIASVGIAALFIEIGLAAPLTLLAVLLVGMMAMLFIKPSLVSPLLERLPLQKFTFRLVRFSETVQTGFRSVPLWRLGVVALLLGLNVTVATTRLYFVLFVLGWPVSWPALLAAFTISLTAGNLSMIPMGLGVRDASFTLLLAQLGVPNEIALSAAVIQRLLSPGWPLLLGLVSTNILGVSELVKRSGKVSPTEGEAHHDPSA
jgi:uncharacterized protein (TIRG00374 family)